MQQFQSSGVDPSQGPDGKCVETQGLRGQQEAGWGLANASGGQQQVPVKYPVSGRDKYLLQGVHPKSR